jgi:DNA-binding ferritin-like protein
MVECLHTISQVARRRLKKLGEADPVSQDLINEVPGGLEKQLWMFESFQAESAK